MADFDVQQVAYDAAMETWDDHEEPTEGQIDAMILGMSVIVPAVTEQVRALHKRVHLVFTWNSGLHAEDPCPECDGKAGEWPCGCWGDYDIEYHCLECSSLTEKHRVAWPCPTVRLLDELDAAARGEQ